MKKIKQIYTFLIALVLHVMSFSEAKANDGDATFNMLQMHIVEITCWQTSFWDSLMMTHTTDSSMPCLIRIDGVLQDTAGIKLKGNSSFSSYPGNKKSIKITFDEYKDTAKFDGLKVINLNNGFKDPTMLREKIFLDFLRNHGIPGPRCNFAKVYINGTYWGLYDLVEQVNKTFLNDVIGNKDGNLFKGDPQGSLQWMGPYDSLYYPKYELKTNDSLNDWSDLVHLIKVINGPSNTFHDSLESVLNTNRFIQQWAMNILFVNLDSYQGSGHNYYIYHNTGTGLFEWIAWDVNETFGNFNQGMGLTQIQSLSYDYIPNPANARPLVQKMLADATYKEQFKNVLCNLLQTDFKPEILEPEIDTLAAFIRSSLYADTQKMYTNQQFEDALVHEITVSGPGGNSIPGLKTFVTERRNSLLQQLSASCISSTFTIDPEPHQIQVVPNPFKNSAEMIFSDHDFKKKRILIQDVTGQVVHDEITSNDRHKISSEGLSQGIYVYSVFDGLKTRHGKFVIFP